MRAVALLQFSRRRTKINEFTSRCQGPRKIFKFTLCKILFTSFPKMPRTEAYQKFQFTTCKCRVGLPFRGRQMQTHLKKFPDSAEHVQVSSFRACLKELEVLSSNATPSEVQAFYTRHASCETGQVNTERSREFFATLQTEEYRERRRQQAPEPPVERAMDIRLLSDEEETLQSVAALIRSEAADEEQRGEEEEATVPSQPVWTNWAAMTPFPTQTEEPNSPLPPSPATSPFRVPSPVPPPPPPPPRPASPQPIIAMRDMESLNAAALKDRLNSTLADNTRMQSQLRHWEERAKSIRHRETVADRREAMLEQSTACYEAAQRNQEEEASRLKEEASRLKEEKAQLRAKDEELRQVHAQLKAKQEKMSRSPTTEIHLPLEGGQIIADPQHLGCNISGGTGCGHLRLKTKSDGRVEVVSWCNVTYRKRPLTSNLYEPPSSHQRKE